MAELIIAERKGDVLTRPTLPCLAPYHAVNLTAGCHYECRYCYAQSFRSYPGHGKVKFYANTLESLSKQLPRKRKLPQMVYFSTACEPFMPFPEILDCLYGCMSLLLESGSRLLISTKASIPARFIELFVAYPGLPHVQMGLTTADDDIRRLMEPNAASISERLGTIRDLTEAGVSCEIRMDPLIPELTDNADRFAEAMRVAADSGVRKGVMSYLFLRRGNMGRLATNHGAWDFRKMAKQVFTQKIEHYCGNNDIRVPATEYRREKYSELQNIAAAHGIVLGLCACKNPDVADACCHPLPNKSECQLFEITRRLVMRAAIYSPPERALSMFKQIDMDKLVAHSDAPSRMSRGMVKKLGQSIQTIGYCKAVVVRPLNDDRYQILDGHSRVESLRTLGRKKVTCDVWDIDDDMARLFIAASSSVKGVSVPELRIGLLFDLLERFSPAELGDMLPESETLLSSLLAFAAEGSESDCSEPSVSATGGLSTGKSTATPRDAEKITMTLCMTRAQYTMIKNVLQGFMQRAKIQDMGEALARCLLDKAG